MSGVTEFLHPTKLGLYQFTGVDEDCRKLYDRMLQDRLSAEERVDENGHMNAIERRIHDVLEYPEAEGILQCIIAAGRDYMGDWFDKCGEVDIENHGLIIEDRSHISTHVDDRDGQVSVVFFLTGEDPSSEYNSVGNPRFVLEDERMTLNAPRLPWEGRNGYSVCPAPGRAVVFPSRAPHNQHPYRAVDPDRPHMQIVANFNFSDMPDFEEGEND
ncbi:MAG: hypothetical protein JJ979_17285 [Roseibium sp.]|nr:hypothetical protein [Roseibium sp.]